MVVMHIVCMDGTGQTKLQARPTNIARIFDAIGGKATDGGNGSYEAVVTAPASATGKYLPGVGTQGDPVLKILGNAFGDGIAEPIVRGYTYLSRSFNPGDQIVIVGFSRGATAARALAGLITAQGLLDKSRYSISDAGKSSAYLRAIAAWYAYRAPHPNLVDQARLEFVSGTLGQIVPHLEPADFTPAPGIQAVGVFDTVSSLGLPILSISGSAVFDFSIVDTALSSAVLNGFHALAADETRDLFSPTFWEERTGISQQIFPGCHSDVGGGFQNRGLSECALEWMLTQLETAGCAFDRGMLDPPFKPDPLDIAQDDGATFPFKYTPRSARSFPHSAVVSSALKLRMGHKTEMLPSLPAFYKPIGTFADGKTIL